MGEQGNSFRTLQTFVEQEHRIKPVDLSTGQVDAESDILLVVSPKNLKEKELSAVDQFLMQGGTVILATSPFDVSLQDHLEVSDMRSGLGDWLVGYGITIEHGMVLAPQNATFPVPVERQTGELTVQETHLVQYPYFVDIRSDGMNRESGLVSGIDQLAMTWASPVSVDQEKNGKRQVVRLLESSKGSWVSDSLDIQPDFNRFGTFGFARGNETGRQALAVMVQGSFDSWFKGKPSPLVEAARKQQAEKAQQAKEQPEMGTEQTEALAEQKAESKQPEVIGKVLERSPASARIILLASNTFLAMPAWNSPPGQRFPSPYSPAADCQLH